MAMLNFTDTGGLFDNFEVNREPIWPKLKWLLAQSAAWHLLLVLCVLMIPPVRNALSIAMVLSGGRFVDKPYNKTEIDDADIIDLTGEKFHYPEGYFAMDQPGLPNPNPLFSAASYTPRTFKPVPAQNPSPSPTPTPIASPSASASPAIAANHPPDSAPKPSVSPKAADDKATEKAQQRLESASKATGIELPQEGEVNKQPFRDLAAYATDLKNQNKLDFDQPFEISIDTELNKDGKLVNPQVTKKSGDPNLTDLAKRLVEAMNDSGVLFYLKKINEDKPGTKVVFTIKQDGKEVLATVESEVASAVSARQLSSAFSLMLGLGADSRKGKDEEILLRSTTVSPDGKKVVFKLNMAHQDVVDIVKRGMEPSPTVSP
jgi:hypothetical protein